MMQVKLEVGSSGYIIESNRIIINVTVMQDKVNSMCCICLQAMP